MNFGETRHVATAVSLPNFYLAPQTNLFWSCTAAPLTYEQFVVITCCEDDDFANKKENPNAGTENVADEDTH